MAGFGLTWYRPLGFLCLVLVSLPMVVGCGPGNELGRMPISGTITLDGMPLERGQIAFEPTDRQEGVRSGAVIENGEYLMKELKGLPPGDYLVRIFASEPAPAGTTAPDGEELAAPGADLPGVSLIPPKYNMQSEIHHTVSADEGEDGLANQFNLDVVTKQ